jgi:hypothetical protein
MKRRVRQEQEATPPAYDRERIRKLIQAYALRLSRGESVHRCAEDEELDEINFHAWSSVAVFDMRLSPPPWEAPPAPPTPKQLDGWTETFLRACPMGDYLGWSVTHAGMTATREEKDRMQAFYFTPQGWWPKDYQSLKP